MDLEDFHAINHPEYPCQFFFRTKALTIQKMELTIGVYFIIHPGLDS
jgi:hypothetical protein